MTVTITHEGGKMPEFDAEALINRVVREAIRQECCPFEVELNFILTDDEGIREANLEFRDLDKPTDVLSFPMIDYEVAADFSHLLNCRAEYFNPETEDLILGDIIISLDKVHEQSEAYGHSGEREIAFLTAHSMLHLFGYDHMNEDERIRMEGKQENILNNLGILR